LSIERRSIKQELRSNTKEHVRSHVTCRFRDVQGPSLINQPKSCSIDPKTKGKQLAKETTTMRTKKRSKKKNRPCSLRGSPRRKKEKKKRPRKSFPSSTCVDRWMRTTSCKIHGRIMSTTPGYTRPRRLCVVLRPELVIRYKKYQVLYF
jgi:hypothetical protein